MPNRAPFDSPFYPYQKVIPGANTLRGAEKIPYKILMYLLDLPDSFGYQPVDDNSRPRVRLAKYLWHEGADPLSQPLPTPAEKRSMLFDPTNPDINTDEDKARHPKGYRLFAQRMIAQSLLDAKAMLKIYPGRILDDDPFRTIIGMQCELWANVNLITNTKTTAYDRVFDMEQALREALSGVNIDGVSTCEFSRQYSSYNGSEILYTDSDMSGRMVYFSILWEENSDKRINTY